MTQAQTVTIPSLPAPLHWRGTPESWSQENGILSIKAGRMSDWFIDPGGPTDVRNAPALLFNVNAPCQLRAHVTAGASKRFDAGVLVVYHDDITWAKLCLEMNPLGQMTVVSVVTKGKSDDCNSLVVDGNSVYLRLSKLDSAYAFHYSLDGKRWSLIRYFSLGVSNNVEIGFIAQSPVGEGCEATFREIGYSATKLADVRSGE